MNRLVEHWLYLTPSLAYLLQLGLHPLLLDRIQAGLHAKAICVVSQTSHCFLTF